MAPALWATALSAGTVALAAAGLRHVAGRGQRLRRAELLLDASHRVTRLRPFVDTLTAVATEAGRIIGSGTGFCIATGPDGRRIGAVVDRDGVRRLATDDEVDAIEALLAADARPRVALLGREPVTTRLSLPPGPAIYLSPPDPEAAVPVVLAVVAARPLPGRGSTLAGTLAALGAPAALAIANARLYEALEAAYTEQLDLNRQKGEFVSTVSHELRTPVAAIRGTLSTVARLGDRLEDVRRTELLEGASGYGERLSRIVEELLLVAAGDREDVGAQVEEVSVRTVLEDVVAATAATAAGRVVVIPSPALVTMRTDADKLRTVLVHLVENAAKFAPEGAIELEAVAAGRQAVFYVTDHGPGIAPEDRERVFERFVQLDQSITRSQGGLGMGLHLARQLAELLGGEIVLTEGRDGGCCFCLAVTRELAPAPARVVQPEPVRPPVREPLPAPPPLREPAVTRR